MRLNTLSKKFLIPTIVFCVVLLGGLGILLSMNSRTTIKQMMDSKGNATADFITKFSADYFAIFDFSDYENFVKAVTVDPSVEFIAFYNAQKEPIMKNKEEPKDGLIMYEREIKDQSGNTVGYLKLGYNKMALTTSAERNLLIIVVSVMVAILLMAVGMTLLVHAIIVRKIKETVKMLRELAEGRGDITRRLRVTSKDEIGEMSRWFNTLVDKVITPLNMAVDYVHKISKGEIPPKISDEMNGSFGDIKKSLNQLIDSMNEITHLAEEIAAGNLMVDVRERSADDKLMKNLRKMVTKLTEVVLLVQKGANEVVDGSYKLKVSSDNLSKGAIEQSSQTEQIAASMTEMSFSINAVVKNASEASVASDETSQLANRGLDTVRDMASGMNRVAATVRESAVTIEELGRLGQEISEITDTIDAIADQTNLLALNAAIEAARAGERGSGFAVVAQEVRKLAEKTSKATGDIAETIKKIQSYTQRAVSGMETVRVEVEKSVQHSSEANKSLSQIADASRRGAGMIQHISTSTEEQASGTSEVSSSMETIAKIARDINSSSEEIKGASKHLSEMAVELKDSVGWFRINGRARG